MLLSQSACAANTSAADTSAASMRAQQRGESSGAGAGACVAATAALDLAELLWTPSLTKAAFFAEHWERRHAHWRAADRLDASYADVLELNVSRTLDLVDSMDGIGAKRKGKGTVATHIRLASTDPVKCGPRARHCRFRCATGEGCARRKWEDGWSIVVSSAHLLVRPLLDLLHAYWRQFGLYVNANLYLSPTGSGAFGYHADETDVFVLQLQGEKRWEVCGRLMPDVNEPAIKWDTVDVSAAWYVDLVANCTRIDLKRGDVLYLPIGTLHRAHGVGLDSLHCTVGMDRTFDEKGKPYKGFDWSGFLALAALGSSGESEQALSSTRRFVRWINQVASTEDTGALRRLPWSWSSDALALPPAQETPGSIRWSSNAFVHSVDPATDLPCLTGTALQGAAGCSSLDALLLHEYEEFVEPILNQHARESSDTIEHLPRVKQHLRSSKLAATLREVRTRMQATMPPLELAAGYEPEAKLRRQAQTADALEAAALVTESTLVRRREGVRVLVEHDPMAWSTIQLRANVPGTKWPQDVHARWATPVTWALSTFGGAAGGSFRAQELYAAVRECSWGSACAIRERETALHVVRWLVGLRLVQVVSEE